MQKWIGEWVAADWGYSHGGRLGRYYFDPHDPKRTDRMDEARFWRWILGLG